MSDEMRAQPDTETSRPGLTTADLAQAAQPRPSPEERSFGQDGSDQGAASGAGQLFPSQDAETFRQRWADVQAGFVDEPRRAVEQADSLVAEAIKRLAEMFAAERSGLEGQWDRGDDVSTEDLRQALQRYRSFFTRLLSI